MAKHEQLSRESVRAPDGAPAAARRAATLPERMLALQRGAGNRAAVAALGRRHLARVTDKQISDRAGGIWEEKNKPMNQTAEQQAADWAEATRQTGAHERETERRANAAWKARGGGASTSEQAREDWLGAEKAIAKEYICERYEDWEAFLDSPAIWGTGVPPGAARSELRAINAKLERLWKALNLKEDLGNVSGTISDIERMIDAWIIDHGSANALKTDQLLLVKMHTLAYERRRYLKMKGIQDRYGITFSGQKSLERHKKGFTSPGNTTSLKKIGELTGIQLYSLEELDWLETVFSRYAPLLGRQRDLGLPAQPLKYFARNRIGLNPGNDPTKDAPTLSPGDFGVTIGDTVAIYDKANRDLVDFQTKPQQFRGTVEHELSHALIEALASTTPGATMLQKFANDMKFWSGNVFITAYRRPDGPKGTRTAAERDGAEPPPSDYGQTNAQEDMAETMMFFFETPDDLARRCPERYRWVRENLGGVLGREFMAALPPLPPKAAPVPDPTPEDILSMFDLFA